MEKTIIKLELTLSEVNGIVGALGTLPYQQVFALIEKIREQTVPQIPQNSESVSSVSE